MELSKFEAAEIQIKYAVYLFIEKKAYLPAITLAGAANGLVDEQQNNIANNTFTNKLSDKFGMSSDDISRFIRKPMNWAKHSNREQSNLDINDIESVAIHGIMRAFLSFVFFNPEYKSEDLKLFQSWLIENKPDYFE